MKTWTMQAPPNLPYQAYRSKRHSRNISANSQQQAQLTPNVSPPPQSRPTTFQNGLTNGHGSSEPVSPTHRDFGFHVNGNGSARDHSVDSEKLGHNGFSRNGANNELGVNGAAVFSDRRKSVSMADVVSQYESKRTSLASDTPVPTVKIVPTTMTVSPAPSSPASSGSSPARSASEPSSASASPPLPPLPSSPTITVSSPLEIAKPLPSINAPSTHAATTSNANESAAGPSSATSTPTASPRPARRTSTFRHVPLRPAAARTPLPSSPLRPSSTLPPQHQHTPSGLSVTVTAVERRLETSTPRTQPLGLQTPEVRALRMSDPPSRVSSLMSTPLIAPTALSAERELPAIPTLELVGRGEPQPHSRPASTHFDARTPEPVVHHPPPRSSSLAPTPQPQSQSQTQPGAHPSRASTTPVPALTSASAISPAPSSSSSRTATTARTPAPYRPGFQPKGVYRPRTDEFLEARRTRQDDGRVERTRLERRLEKLINLHFPHPDATTTKEEAGGGKGKEVAGAGGRPAGLGTPNRRASSFFDLDLSSIRGKSASELWRGVVQAQVAGGKNDIRAAEQVITPWEEDASVSQCPLCASSFHPITNRKHHCRLCGRIICSLPVKYPQRPQTCSLLFVADPLTREVEEVGEGVDYGVRRRTSSNAQSPKGKGRDDPMGLSDDEKFLRGVRICRDCRPVLLRRQYTQEVHRIPLFTRLYEAFVALEKEIEEALPQFQELILSISHEERPTPEASAARKRLLEAFAQYDALAKRIRKLPCPGGPGSSHDRVQQAIVSRANDFLQKHMFPLQALPKPQKHSSSNTSSPVAPDTSAQMVDPDSQLAQVLQPLLEQEALLESFVEEAKAHRKFEDVQTLKANLVEIRVEIDKILANSEGNLREARPTNGGKGKKR